MRRIVLWLAGTVTALVLLFGYPTSTSSTPAAAGSAVVAPAEGGTAADAVTVTGDAVDTEHGPVQVRLTIEDGAVTAVEVVRTPGDGGRSAQINARALPILVQETLDAQGADIDMVSGATDTSEGYVESLQSALDAAGL
ncbi:FMN-binding protein [Geodermatophilus sp. SYSU D00815]